VYRFTEKGKCGGDKEGGQSFLITLLSENKGGNAGNAVPASK